MQADELLANYREKADEDLLLLAEEQDQLTAEARDILTLEMSRRGIGKQKIAEYHEEVEKFEQAEAAEKLQKEVQTWAMKGGGKTWYGKQNRSFDPETQVEEFTTTMFLVVCLFPLIPRGTYRVQRLKSFWNSSELRAVERLPLDWEQVLKVWVTASAIALASIWALIIFGHFYYR